MSFKSIRRSRDPSRDTARLAIVLAVTAALLAGCAAPNPDTAAGAAEIAGQKCNVCIVENPGDASPCYAICSRRVEDQAAYQRAIGR